MEAETGTRIIHDEEDIRVVLHAQGRAAEVAVMAGGAAALRPADAGSLRWLAPAPAAQPCPSPSARSP